MKTSKEKIEEIKRVTGLKINSVKAITTGAESYLLEVNRQWIFRFPKKHISNDMKKRWDFLSSFSKVSPIKVPRPEYLTDTFIGYIKIAGEPLLPSQIERLGSKDKLKIAKQLGLFLRTLHNYKDKRINFPTGYLVMKRKDYQVVPKEISRHLNNPEHQSLERKLKKISQNALNFRKPITIIHGDLNFNNILWDKKRKLITGVLDWSDMGLGVPAMDFIEIADFNKDTNDQFLRDILRSYAAKETSLFTQIKENAIIDVMNWYWFYKKTDNKVGANKIIRQLKTVLSSN